jgi:hypothetical protein
MSAESILPIHHAPDPAPQVEPLQNCPEAGLSRAPLESLLTPREAAKLLKVSESWLWQNTAPRGAGVPCLKLGRSVRYAPADLAAFINGLRSERTGQGK